ncbi:MAG: hypothetical protein IH949_09880, partial [Bacteroidetes bacterium]|nr:hypothetical protein [Bacteroidota bacterium]
LRGQIVLEETRRKYELEQLEVKLTARIKTEISNNNVTQNQITKAKLTKEEKQRAEQLAKERYRTKEWNESR